MEVIFDIPVLAERGLVQHEARKSEKEVTDATSSKLKKAPNRTNFCMCMHIIMDPMLECGGKLDSTHEFHFEKQAFLAFLKKITTQSLDFFRIFICLEIISFMGAKMATTFEK